MYSEPQDQLQARAFAEGWAWAPYGVPPPPPLPVAPIGKRILAYLIDVVLEGIVIVIPMVATFVWVAVQASAQRGNRPGPVAVGALVVLWLVLIALGILYRPVCEARWGKTLGKAVMKLRVVMEDGRPCTGWAAFLRYLLFLVDGLLNGVVGLLIAVLDDTGRYQRLGDRVAHTVVVDDVAYGALLGGAVGHAWPAPDPHPR